MQETLVQYVVIRRDLPYPRGAFCAQAVHAAVAALHKYGAAHETRAYLDGAENMHTICLEVADLEALQGLKGRLDAASLESYLWVEEPEHEPVSLALRPYAKNAVQYHFRGMGLFK